MATKEKRPKKTETRFPEKKWGPFAGGAGVAVWLNEFGTETGTRYARTITFSPRRFRDPKTNEWRDGAYRPVDLPALLLAIDKAQTENPWQDPLPRVWRFAHNRHFSPFEPGELDSPTSANHTRT